MIIIGPTLLHAFMTTAICLILSFPVAHHISRQRPEVKTLLIYLVTLPFWVSMIVRVYSWTVVPGTDGVRDRALTGLNNRRIPVNRGQVAGGIIPDQLDGVHLWCAVRRRRLA